MGDFFKAVSAILKGLDAPEKVGEEMVFALFRQAAGKDLEKHIIPQRLEKRTLYAAVIDETWRKQLSDLTGPMLYKLNQAFGVPQVNRIVFSVDPDAFIASREAAEAEAAAIAERDARIAREMTPELRRFADEIADEGLRAAFLGAAAGSLARKRKDGS